MYGKMHVHIYVNRFEYFYFKLSFPKEKLREISSSDILKYFYKDYSKKKLINFFMNFIKLNERIFFKE